MLVQMKGFLNLLYIVSFHLLPHWLEQTRSSIIVCCIDDFCGETTEKID